MWVIRDLKILLSTCSELSSISKLHCVIIKIGNSGNRLFASYYRIGHIDLAHKVFDDLPLRSVASWNALLIGYSRGNDPLQVVNLYKRMRLLESTKPDSSTFTMAIKACTSLSDAELGEEIWENAVESGYGYDIFVCSSVLSLYSKCGKMEKAKNVFEGMSKRDVVSWSTMISGFVNCCRPREAVEIYRRMLNEGVESDGVLILALVRALAYLKDLKIASSFHSHLIRNFSPMDIMLQTCLIDMYSKNGKLQNAYMIFKSMIHKNVVSWSSLISGFVQNGYPIEALELLHKMQSYDGLNPDEVSVLSAILACSEVGLTLLGKELHGYVLKNLDMNQVLVTALIDMYAKCGSISHSRILYKLMGGSRDVVLWNTIIACHGIHGQGKEALSVFLQMFDTNIKPDDATFASLLSALSHSGLVKEGQHWFEVMVKDYKIRPTEKHHVSLIDLLARAGEVEKAHALIESMEYKPGVPIWVALLSGCLKNKKFIIGELAARKILELKPESPGVYALVSNFFCAAMKWDEVLEIKQDMKVREMRKEAAFSAIELQGKVHSFVAEDKCNPQYVQLESILGEINHEMRYGLGTKDEI